jgi:hypothetical protein
MVGGVDNETAIKLDGCPICVGGPLEGKEV